MGRSVWLVPINLSLWVMLDFWRPYVPHNYPFGDIEPRGLEETAFYYPVELYLSQNQNRGPIACEVENWTPETGHVTIDRFAAAG